MLLLINYQQLVTVSFQNWVGLPVCNAVMIALALERVRDPLREFIYHLSFPQSKCSDSKSNWVVESCFQLLNTSTKMITASESETVEALDVVTFRVWLIISVFLAGVLWHHYWRQGNGKNWDWSIWGLCAKDRQKLCWPCHPWERFWIQRQQVPSCHQRLYDPGRRFHQRRWNWRFVLWWSVSPCSLFYYKHKSCWPTKYWGFKPSTPI